MIFKTFPPTAESDQGVPKKDKVYQLLVSIGLEEYEGEDPIGVAAAFFEPAWDAEALVYRATGPLKGFKDEVSRGNRAEQPKDCFTVRIPMNTNIYLIGPKTIEELRSEGIHTNADILNHSAHLAQGIHGIGPQRQESLQQWAYEVSTHEDLLAQTRCKSVHHAYIKAACKSRVSALSETHARHCIYYSIKVLALA